MVDAAGIEDIHAFEALKEHKMYKYLKSQNVTYLVDSPLWIFDLYVDRWGMTIEDKLELLYNPLQPNENKTIVDPIVYRLK